MKAIKLLPQQVEIVVLNMQWGGVLGSTSPAAVFRCSACRSKIGAGRFAIAWIRDGDVERSMRLCEACAIVAEQELNKTNP